MYGARYGTDGIVLSNSSMADEGACCQACYRSAACLYWDFERSTGVCRLKPDQGGTIPPGQTIPGFWRDPDRVAGGKNGKSATATGGRLRQYGSTTNVAHPHCHTASSRRA
jgi:hypothetical protein